MQKARTDKARVGTEGMGMDGGDGGGRRDGEEHGEREKQMRMENKEEEEKKKERKKKTYCWTTFNWPIRTVDKSLMR